MPSSRAAALIRVIQRRRKLALAVAPVAVGVHPRPLHLLFGEAVGGMLAAEVALRFLEDLAALLARVDGALDAAHLLASEQLADRSVRRLWRSRPAAPCAACASATSSPGCGSSTRDGRGACPLAVLRKRFLAPEWVFIFGIGSAIEADRDGFPPVARVRCRPMRILYVVGTRPNFVKTAPVIGALREPPARRPARDRPHRPALRPADVGGLPRGARRARARPHARGRLRHPRPADGADDGAARAGARRARSPTWWSSPATSTRPWRRC